MSNDGIDVQNNYTFKLQFLMYRIDGCDITIINRYSCLYVLEHINGPIVTSTVVVGHCCNPTVVKVD